MAIKVEWEGRHGLYRKYYGTLAIEDIMKANLEFIGDERSDDLRYVIADFLDVEKSSIGAADISKISIFDKPAERNIQRLKIAFVVRGETQQALARLYQHESADNSWECEVFDSVEEARKWI